MTTLASVVHWKRERAVFHAINEYMEWEKEQMLERLFAPNLLYEAAKRRGKL